MTASSSDALEIDVDMLSEKTLSIAQSGPLSDVDILSNASEPAHQSEEELAFEDCDSDARSDNSSTGSLFDEALSGLSLAPCSKASHWIPGSNVVPWISRGAPIREQAQVLVVNVVASLLQVPGRVLTTLLKGVDVSNSKNSKVLHVSANLLGMSVSINKTF